jgi:plastocyanin
MSMWGYRVSVTLIAIGAVCVLVGALAAMTLTPSREIRLVARGMAFYLETDPSTPNPTITVKAGERVRIVLRNEDRGFVHDFAVPAVDEAVDQVNWNQVSAATFDMPSSPGTYEYICQPHRLMMSGTLFVR